jgi:hypothetical protein
MEYNITTAVYNVPSIPPFPTSSPSTSDPDLPELLGTPEELDEIVVDTKMLEMSDDGPSLGVWNLSNWQTLEFTMSDLLIVRG